MCVGVNTCMCGCMSVELKSVILKVGTVVQGLSKLNVHRFSIVTDK